MIQSGKILGVVPKTYLPGLQGVLRGALVLLGRGARLDEVEAGGRTSPPSGPTCSSPFRTSRRHARGRDLRGPLGPRPARAAPRGGGGHRAPEPLRLERARGQGGLPPRAGAASSRAGRSPPTSTRTRGSTSRTTDLVFGGHLLVAENAVLLAEGERFRARRRSRRDRRGHGAAAAWSACARPRSPTRVGDPRPGYRRVALQPIPSTLARTARAPGRPAPLRPRPTPRPSTSAAARSSPSRPRASPSASSTRGSSGASSASPAASTPPSPSSWRTGPSTSWRARGATILAVTMPGFGTTRAHARERAPARRGAPGASCARSTSAPPARSTSRTSASTPRTGRRITFQNLQARERTQVLMDLANKEGGARGGHGRPLRAGPRLLARSRATTSRCTT